MAITFALYYDAGRTNLVDTLRLSGINDDLAAPVQMPLFVGPAAGKRAMSADGQAIQLMLGGTSDISAGAWKLSLTQSGLATAIPGTALQLPSQLDGVLGFWLEVDCRGIALGEHTGITFQSTLIKEVSL
ncbi:hypothetical protein [uncultured Aquitalea sp.]|uniref:hypothetical protein n=1 Tax=uncultured Aquitalea sp. TaxID=540272 RepID=UPI0025DBC62C|nr:hypothetical protein [uncultured Aquitalea sp.]